MGACRERVSFSASLGRSPHASATRRRSAHDPLACRMAQLRAQSVRQLVRQAASIVRFEWRCEPDSPELRSTVEQGSSDPVHAVHDSPVVPQDDRIRDVHVADQLAMLDDLANGGNLGASIKPVRRIDFGDRVDGHSLNRQIPAQDDETIDIPGVESGLCRPEVVLLSHRTQSRLSRLTEHRRAIGLRDSDTQQARP